MIIIENNEITTRWNHLNSGLEKLVISNPNYVSIRINGSQFDNLGNLWIANGWVLASGGVSTAVVCYQQGYPA